MSFLRSINTLHGWRPGRLGLSFREWRYLSLSEMDCNVALLVLLVLFKVQHIESSLIREYDSIYKLYADQRLDLPAESDQKSIQVDDTMDCVFKCNSIYWCLSINFKTTPLANGRHVCELLSSLQFLNRTSLKLDYGYSHYSTKVS